MELALQFIISALNAFIFISLLVSQIRRTTYPWWILYAIIVTLCLCTADALIRWSFWPVLTAIFMGALLIVVWKTREYQIQKEVLDRDREYLEHQSRQEALWAEIDKQERERNGGN